MSTRARFVYVQVVIKSLTIKVLIYFEDDKGEENAVSILNSFLLTTSHILFVIYVVQADMYNNPITYNYNRNTFKSHKLFYIHPLFRAAAVLQV